jgi:hypothetical protein
MYAAKLATYSGLCGIFWTQKTPENGLKSGFELILV